MNPLLLNAQTQITGEFSCYVATALSHICSLTGVNSLLVSRQNLQTTFSNERPGVEQARYHLRFYFSGMCRRLEITWFKISPCPLGLAQQIQQINRFRCGGHSFQFHAGALHGRSSDSSQGFWAIVTLTVISTSFERSSRCAGGGCFTVEEDERTMPLQSENSLCIIYHRFLCSDLDEKLGQTLITFSNSPSHGFSQHETKVQLDYGMAAPVQTKRPR